MRCDSPVAQATINHWPNYCLGEVIQGRVNPFLQRGGVPEQPRTGRSCEQKSFILPELYATSLALHPSFVWAGARAVGKAGFGAEGLTVQSTEGNQLLSKARNPEQLFFFVLARG